jgi:hypothetical protein
VAERIFSLNGHKQVQCGIASWCGGLLHGQIIAACAAREGMQMIQTNGILYTIQFLTFFFENSNETLRREMYLLYQPPMARPSAATHHCKDVQRRGTLRSLIKSMCQPECPFQAQGRCHTGADTCLKNRPQLVYLLYQAPDAPTFVGIAFNSSSVSNRTPKKPLIRPRLLSLCIIRFLQPSDGVELNPFMRMARFRPSPARLAS